MGEEAGGLLETLEPEWLSFQSEMDETTGRLEKFKDNFRCARGRGRAAQARGEGQSTVRESA